MLRRFLIALVVLGSSPAARAQAPTDRPLLGLSRALNLLGGADVDVRADEDAAASASASVQPSQARSAPQASESSSRASHWCSFRVKPVEFVGEKNECFANYPAGAGFVTAEWTKGMGLPDNGRPNSNPADTRDNPAKKDRHFGLLLSKNGPTPDCSAAGARLSGTPKTFVLNELGFDYRNGSHCGAGSPRFNAITPDGHIYFIGCVHGSRTPAPQDPTEWTRVRFNDSSVFPQLLTNPPFRFGVTPVARLVVVADEGTDTPLAESPSGVGLIVLDNLILNGHLETGP
jgi:hypothetical protein